MARTKTASVGELLPVTIRYDGPTDQLDITQDGVMIARGKTGQVSVEAAQHLLGCSYADIIVIAGDVPAVWPGTAAKVDQLASRLGVEFPRPTNGNPPLTAAEKIAHLEQAGYSPDGTRQDENTTDPDTKETE